MNMRIWEIGILNQLFVRGSCTEIKYSKNYVVNGKTTIFVVCPFCGWYSICLIIGF